MVTLIWEVAGTGETGRRQVARPIGEPPSTRLPHTQAACARNLFVCLWPRVWRSGRLPPDLAARQYRMAVAAVPAPPEQS